MPAPPGGRGAGDALDVLEMMPLRDLPPDYYKIKVSVLDPSGAVFLSRAEDLGDCNTLVIPKSAV